MSTLENERKAIEAMRALAEKIRHELLDPECNALNLCRIVEQSAVIWRHQLESDLSAERATAAGGARKE